MSVKSYIRQVKNFSKGYSDIQIKVRQATCNDHWGPSGSLMAEITEHCYSQRDFYEIMDIIVKRLNDSGKNWRHVFKALTLLEYLVCNGPESVIEHAKSHLHYIKTLKEFQYLDEEGRDQGANVRQKSKELTSLLTDESKLQDARKNRAQVRSRMNFSARSPGGDSEYDDELRRAIEESKKTAAAENRARSGNETEDEDLQRAIELSEKEAIQRRINARDQEDTGDKSGNIIDLFGSLEETSQIGNAAGSSSDPFAAFGGVDPFTFQQQQNTFNQQLAFQQQQQQMLQQQLALQQQQQLLQQQQPFNSAAFQQFPASSNPFNMQPQQVNPAANANANPFGGFGLQQQPTGQPLRPQQTPLIPQQSPASPPQQALDLSRNPNSTIDPFASVSSIKSNPVGPNTSLNNPLSTGSNFNPFGGSAVSSQPSSSPSEKPALVNLDATSLATKSSPQINKNPFSTSNANRYQWEPPKQTKPSMTLAQMQGGSNPSLMSGPGISGLGMQQPMQQQSLQSQQQPFASGNSMNMMGQQGFGGAAVGNPFAPQQMAGFNTVPNQSFGGFPAQAPGGTPFGQQMQGQPFQQGGFGGNPNPMNNQPLRQNTFNSSLI